MGTRRRRALGRAALGAGRARKHKLLALAWAAVSLLIVATACSGGSHRRPNGEPRGATPGTGLAPTEQAGSAGSSKPPNFVFVLTDDLSWNLINERFTPHIVDLQRRGETFDHYFVTDSLCCPSRSTIFTGLYPHDTKVETNRPPDGGFEKFQAQHLDTRTFAVALQAAGYQTSMLGKYLNGYGDPMNPSTAPVPPGWSDWHVSNNTGYLEFNYLLNDNGKYNRYSGTDKYGVDVLNSYARSFIEKSAGKPFLVEVATFAPHAPYTPAPRNANDFPGLTQPRDPSFGASNENPPAWLGQRRALSDRQVAKMDADYRKRVQATESVDKMLGDIESTLTEKGLADNTYVFFSSDNGYHLGQHRLLQGKQTAFDTDIRVPLIVAGPGVPAGRTESRTAQNTDLYPTFLELAGAKVPASVDGHSLVPLLHPTGATTPWRTAALIEHHGPDKDPADPDFQPAGGNPTSYEAVRVSARHLPGFSGPVEAVYVEYQDRSHEIEYYDLSADPYEQRNVASSLSGNQRAELHRLLAGLQGCHGQEACWAAGLPS